MRVPTPIHAIPLSELLLESREEVRAVSARRLLRGWLGLSVGSLVMVGIFALLVAFTRTPAVQLLKNPGLFHIAIVAHVIFSLVVWFMAFAGTLWVYMAWRMGYRLSPGVSWAALGATVVGGALMAFPAFAGLGEAYLNDYVPVIDHPLFWTGLVVTGLGVMVQALGYLAAWLRDRRPDDPAEGLGMAVGAAAMVVAVLTVAVAALRMETEGHFSIRLRALFWGGGHVLQFVHVAGMASVWLLAARLALGREVPASRWLKRLFVWFLPFILATFGAYLFWTPIPLLTNKVVAWSVAAGLGLPTIPLALLAAGALLGGRGPRPWGTPLFSGSILSFFLYAMGGVMAILGFRQDLRVPAHYHGMVGAVTLAYMGLAPTLLELTGRRPWKAWLTRLQPYLYGIGVITIMLALHWAGSMGAPRKTFGFTWANARAIVAMNLVGIGALLAILGGITFVLNMGIPLLGRGEVERGDRRLR